MKWKNCLLVCLSIMLIGFLRAPRAEAVTVHSLHPTFGVQDFFSLYDAMTQEMIADGRREAGIIHGDVKQLKEDDAGNRPYYKMDFAMNRNMMVVANRQGQVMRIFISYPKSEWKNLVSGMLTLGSLVLMDQPLSRNESLMKQDMEKMAVALKQSFQSKIGVYNSTVAGRAYCFFLEIQENSIVGGIASVSE